MSENIVFIGGIHGVGKSTICKQISSELNLHHLLASELLKWKEVTENINSKSVRDISDTQNRLILGLQNIVEIDKYYLLDGHYCLLNKQNGIENIPLNTFQQINPISLILILGDISVIKERLEIRDNKPYEYKLLQRFQNQELEYAKYLSKTLGITLNITSQNDYSELITSLRKILNISENPS